MRVALIVNPRSGGKSGEKQLPRIQKKLQVHGITVHTVVSLFHEHIPQLVSRLDIHQYDAIVAVGGDGTNFQVLNGLLSTFPSETLPPIGIVPVGSGNSFAKDLNIHTLDDGIRSIVQNRPRPVDVCSFTQAQKKIYFVNLAGVGFVTDVAQTAHKFKFLRDFSYVIGVFYRTLHLAFHSMELEIDGQMISGKNCFVEFCNSRFTGGSMLMAPFARIDDGFMDIIVAGPLSRASLLATLPKIYKGTHLDHPCVRYFKARQARIITWPKKTILPDGEFFGTTPSTIRVHPGLVQYLG